MMTVFCTIQIDHYLGCTLKHQALLKNIPVRKIKVTDAEAIVPENFSVRTLNDLLKGQDLLHDLHRHDFYFLLAVKKGSGNHEIDFTPYPVTDLSVFILRPGQVHQLNLSSGSEGYIVEFGPEFYHRKDLQTTQILNKASSKNLCALNRGRPNKLFLILENIHQEYQNKQEGYLDVIRYELGVFFIELLRQRQNKTTPATSTKTHAQEQLDKLLRMIEQNMAAHKEVSFYAGQLNLSAYQLNAITKSSLGKTCSDLINDQIILEAKRYLLATSNQVNQIAYHLGYEDVSYFIRFFKKHTGHSPDVFRQISR